MKLNDSQLGKPEVLYKDTLANILNISGTEGMVAWATDAKVQLIYDGTKWLYEQYGYLVPVPSTDGWSWSNQNDCTMDTTNGYWSFSDPYNASWDIHRYERNIPNPPYTFTTLINCNPYGQFQMAGISLSESSSGKSNNFCSIWYNNSAGRSLYNYYVSNNSGANEVSYYKASPWVYGYFQPVWLRIQDDNTNWNFSFGQDGKNFQTVLSMTRNTSLTADKIGFHIASRGGISPNPTTMQVLTVIIS